MRKLALLLSLAMLLIAASTASAATRECREISATVGAIKAKNVSCKRARKVVKAHSTGTEKPFGYSCIHQMYEGGVTWKCRKGDKRVIYSRAD